MVCPFLEASLRACRKNLSLDHMESALAYCCNEYTKCAIFKKNMLKLCAKATHKTALSA